MLATHAALIIGLVFVGIILFTLFLFSTSPEWWLTQVDDKSRLTTAEWLERAARESADE
ncbi:MAG TPA: hypothetical protein VHD90_00285 [Phototrophicaceae bacterium]|nr:hypothetical protein [Phototrophicaceae bacterium]